MVFSSITFLFYFLPIFLALYFLTPTVFLKNIVTLLFSLVFYAWGGPRFLLILIFSIAFNYVMAIVIDRREGLSRKQALAIGVAGNLLVLGLFKYANFITGNVAELLKPLGLELTPTNIELALYISLFPQLVAGPIVRYKTVARQLDKRRFTLGRASAGARIFIVGLAQKVLVADIVAPLAQVAFDHSPHRSLAEAWIGLLAYSIQIYFDFAGYSNMAIGLGIVLGFTFPRNFRLPYTSVSITEFWRRWHMSLSSWLRDYLYIPLGGNRGTNLQTYRNLVTVFVLCGAWHGANWTFILWGVWHGVFLVVERLGLGPLLKRIPAPTRWLYALLAVMCGWVMFRAADLKTALDYYASLAGLNGAGDISFDMHNALSERAMATLAIGCVLATAPRFVRHLRAPIPVRAAGDYAWTFAILVFSMVTVAAGAYSPFLYFKF